MWPPDARHALGAHQPGRRARGGCGAHPRRARADRFGADRRRPARNDRVKTLGAVLAGGRSSRFGSDKALAMLGGRTLLDHAQAALRPHRSEEHTSELQSLMRISYAVFCLKKKKKKN